MAEVRISAGAWEVLKPGPEQGRWRGYITRPGPIGRAIIWEAPQTEKTRDGALRAARSHARRLRVELSR
jgi:hypothetical protein